MNQFLVEDIEYIAGCKLPWGDLENSTFLITGANGFLPSYMVEVLLFLNDNFSSNIKVFALVRNKEKALNRFAKHLGRKDLIFVFQDVCSPIQHQDSINPDYIIHAASQASPVFYGIDPLGTIRPNIIGTLNLLDISRRCNSRSFMFFSSGEVYGNVSENQIPTSEKDYGYLDPDAIRSCYGESKRMGENICFSYNHQHNIPIRVIRPFHTYGPGVELNDGRVFADFIADVISNRDLVLTSDGSATRAFCYVADAIEGFFTVLLKGENDSYNVGNDKETSILQLANSIIGLFPEKKLKLSYKIDEKPSGYVKSTISRGCPDISKIRKLGWRPITSIEKGFYKTIKSYE